MAQNDADLSLLEANPIVDHRRYTNPGDPNTYATSKIETEALWEATAELPAMPRNQLPTHDTHGDIILKFSDRF